MTWQPPRESANHAPTELCPHPEWWSAWNPISTEVEVSMLVAAFVKACQPETILEVGSHYGQTTQRIAQVIRENGHGEFVSLEINPEMVGSASNLCKDYLNLEVKIIHIDSLAYIPKRLIDFLFVDGSERRSLDVEHYLPYLSPHCVVIVHDAAYYLSENDLILKLWKWDHINLNTPRGLLVLTR